MVQFTGELVKMYGITAHFVKLVHAFQFESSHIIKAAVLPNTTDILMLMKHEPYSLFRFDLEDSRSRRLDLKQKWGV